jgi:hypothetical protein
MAAPFQTYSIDVGANPFIPAYASLAMMKGAIGENRSVELGYENIDQLLPYDGTRKVVHRSNSAKTGALVGKTAADDNQPRIIGFESSLERAVAISALIHPNTVGLKCQPRHVKFEQKIGDVGSNILDFLLTLRNGQRTYLYVKNNETLGRDEQALICEQIRLQLPENCGFAVVSEASFPPQLRGNNERILLAKKFPDPEADARLGEVLDDILDVPKFTIEELVIRGAGKCVMAQQGRMFDAVLRAIADQHLEADKRRLIDYPTVVGRPA